MHRSLSDLPLKPTAIDVRRIRVTLPLPPFPPAPDRGTVYYDVRPAYREFQGPYERWAVRDGVLSILQFTDNLEQMETFIQFAPGQWATVEWVPVKT